MAKSPFGRNRNSSTGRGQMAGNSGGLHLGKLFIWGGVITTVCYFLFEYRSFQGKVDYYDEK